MRTDISKVMITGGRETGGLQSFATTLAGGFADLGIPAEVISPRTIYSRWRDLRNPEILKILSTTAVFVAPFSRRTICMAHGFPRADAQGWVTVLALVASFKTSRSRNSRLVAISHYAASHLKAIYDIAVDGVIHNPLNPIFFESVGGEDDSMRHYLTYVGRLHPVKNIDKLLPAMQAALEDCPELRICIVGDGLLRGELDRRFGCDSRVQFTGDLDIHAVRNILRRTKVFISGCETEALGIAYLEALSQGCAAVMPACGGGLEIAPELIGGKIQLLPLSFDCGQIRSAILRALCHSGTTALLDSFQPKTVARQYLEIAARIL
jgi:glycosyltransferase involved in cell wall biosynthesis